MTDHVDPVQDEESRRSLERLRNVSPAEWESFVGRLTAAAREAAARVMSGAHDWPSFDREDLAAEVLVNVLRSPRVATRLFEADLRGGAEQDLSRYLLVVARNRLRDEARKSSHQKETTVDAPLAESAPDAPQDHGSQEESFLLSLDETLQALSPEERKVIDLKYWQDKPLHLIAREMGMSVTSTFRLLHRAVERIKERLRSA